MMEFEKNESPNARILVVGVGGGGCNAVNRMIDANLKNADFLALNTDKQVLASCKAENKMHIGEKATKGLGAGGNPQIGQNSAEESIEDIKQRLEGTDMVFVTAGMGGGTGTGAAPVVAKAAKDMGILTVAVVTKPFVFEGRRRTQIAESGIKLLKEFVDSIVIVPNDKLLEIADDDTSFLDAFKLCDEALKQGVQGITDLIGVEGMINLDFADVETVMRDKGVAHMGIGSGTGNNKVKEAVTSAVESPLLETTVAGAKGILLNVTGGFDMGMKDVYEAAKQIQDVADPDAIIIFGAAVAEDMKDSMSVTVIATGFENELGNYADRLGGASEEPKEEEKPVEEPAEDAPTQPAVEEATPEPTAEENRSKTFSNLLDEVDHDDNPSGQSETKRSRFDIPSFLK